MGLTMKKGRLSNIEFLETFKPSLIEYYKYCLETEQIKLEKSTGLNKLWIKDNILMLKLAVKILTKLT